MIIIITEVGKYSLIKAFSNTIENYGLVKNLNNKDLIDSFWISSQSKPVSITHESDL